MFRALFVFFFNSVATFSLFFFLKHWAYFTVDCDLIWYRAFLICIYLVTIVINYAFCFAYLFGRGGQY